MNDADRPRDWTSVNDMRRKLHAAKSDPFQTETTSYDPDAHYHLASVDSKGHSAEMRCPVPPGMKVMAEEIVAMREHPYRTANDIMRDGFFHMMNYLAEVSADPEHAIRMRRIMAQENIDQHGRDMEQNAKFVEQVRHYGTAASQGKDWKILRKVISDAVDFSESAHEPYRTQLDELIARLKAELPKNIDEEVDQ